MLRKLFAASFVAALFALPLAFAQTAPSTPPTQAEPQRAAWHERACTERYARMAGRLAYLEARLELTADEHPLWDKWRDAVVSGADQQRALCRQGPLGPGAHSTIVERQAHFGKIAAARAQTLQTAQPALEALYKALSPEQREVLDHPRREDWRHHGWRGQRMQPER
jgi:hypothetical protein